jgi:sulfate permease, SulP family
LPSWIARRPVRWFIVDAGAITDIDYSAAQSVRDLLDNLARQTVGMVFSRVSRHLRSDMDRQRDAEAFCAAAIEPATLAAT